jgi:hypothetical protein
MTPEQKAQQLYELFWNHAFDRTKARDAAISCTNEIIKAVDDFDNELYSYEGVRMSQHKDYYENVKSYLKSYK